MSQNWWRGAVIYQIYPRSYQDSTGNGIGDLPGILSRLEHVASLGVDAIWLSPFFTSPMEDMGYDVSNYKDVDPLFGTLADFDALVKRAHELGLKVIIDQVISHTSDKHEWFQKSRASRNNEFADWYVWVDPEKDGSPPNNWPSVFGGSAWEWNTARQQYYLHNFLTSQPDLNFHNPAVQDAMLDVLRFWLERGVDGFRFDTVNYYFHDDQLRDNPPAPDQADFVLPTDPYGMQDHLYSKNRPENVDYLRRIRALMDEFGATTTVGEVGEALHALEIMSAYTAGDDLLHMCYSFDMLGKRYGPEFFRSRIVQFFEAAPDGWPCWSFSNHDVVRHATRWAEHAPDTDTLSRQLIALISSLRGSVCLYQGEELALTESELEFEELTDPPGIRFWPGYKGRDGCRTPIPWVKGPSPNGFTTGKPWLPIKPPQSAKNVEDAEAQAGSVLHFYREMLAFRKDHQTLVTGDIDFMESGEKVLSFTRSGEGGKALFCVFNLSNSQAEADCPEGVSDAAPLLGSATSGSSGKLKLGPAGFAFFALEA